MCKFIKNDKGITLLEIIISIAIVGILLTLTFNLFFFGNEVFARGSEQYNVQTSVRISTTSITDTVRYATALYIESNKPDTFEDPYHYIYYENGIVYYSYIDSDSTRKTRFLGTDITSLEFSKQSDRLVSMSVTGIERNQTYEIDMDIGLPNMEMKNNDVFGSAGSVLKFQKDSTITNLSASNEVRLNREANFSMFNGDDFLFVANKDVTWAIISGTGVSIISSTDRTAVVQASGTIGDQAWIRATSIADSSKYREVRMTIVEQTSSAKIVKSEDLSEITGELNLVVGESQELKVIIDPPLDIDEGITIDDINWYGTNSGQYSFDENIADPNDTVLITGVNVGALADLTARIDLSDGTILYDTIIINVTSTMEYAKLIDLSFGKGVLSPTFNSDVLNYTVSGDKQETLVANANTGTTIIINPLPTNTNGKYDLSESINISITVSEDGKITRIYTITN